MCWNSSWNGLDLKIFEIDKLTKTLTTFYKTLNKKLLQACIHKHIQIVLRGLKYDMV